MASEHSASVRSLILVPSVLTLAVTLLRLAGERMDWAPALFSREAGGGGALVGIAWLVPVFGFYFGMKLARIGPAPSGGAALGQMLLALALVAASGFFVGGVLKKGPAVVIPTVMVVGIISSWIAWRAWPALGRTLLAYGLAARVPVMIVMLLAFLGNWGTHYDALPPGFPPDTSPVAKWFQLGVVPQLFIWVSPYTIVLGALFGAIALLVTGRARRSATA